MGVKGSISTPSKSNIDFLPPNLGCFVSNRKDFNSILNFDPLHGGMEYNGIC